MSNCNDTYMTLFGSPSANEVHEKQAYISSRLLPNTTKLIWVKETILILCRTINNC